MKIINLKAENVKKIKAVDITPTSSTVVITGKNGQGKSSILDSILYALAGKDALKNTPKPIREGQENARIELDLGEYKVIRTFTTTGTTRLEVVSKDGAKYGSPQTMLDEIVGKIAFDPLAFANMKPEDQRNVLLDVLGLTQKVAELQAMYRGKFEERTIVGRELKTAEGHAASIQTSPNAPEKPIDTLAVSNELRARQEQNKAIEEAQGELKQTQRDIAELEKELEELKEAEEKYKNLLKGKELLDLEDLANQLATAGQLNQEYEQAQEAKKAKERVEQKRVEQANLTKELEQLLKQKDELVTSAKLPISGLNIDAEGVTFNGMPFSQLSSAEQLKVSLAIAMAMNPELRVMRIMDGSLLDSDNMQVIQKMATAEDYQVWVERVQDVTGVGIVIENGEVKE